MTEKFQHKKSLGQHFLNSDVVPKWMCDAGAVGAGDIVLEIGPGTGVLTRELLKRGAFVKAVEADPRAIESLKNTFPDEIANKTLVIFHGDMRKMNAVDVSQTFNLRDHEYKIVANIPYYLSGLLFRTFLETVMQPKILVFLVQKEVAQRIARDQKESLLSLSTKVFGEPQYVRTVTKGHFTPPPAIDSAILAINDINRTNFELFTMKQFFFLLKTSFSQKRKQLSTNLHTDYTKESVEQLLTELNLPPKSRAEDLSIKNWLDVANSLLALNK